MDTPHPAAPARRAGPGRAKRTRTATAAGGERVRVLLVEPDAEHARRVVAGLARHGVATEVCGDGAEALLRTGILRPDAVVTGSRIPGMEVDAFVAAVRKVLDVPVLVGTGERDVASVTRALDAGATACVAHPYRLPQLLALLAPSRWSGSPEVPEPRHEEVLRAGPIELSPAGYWLRLDKRRVDLAPREFALLKELMVHAGTVVTRDRIWREVWGRTRPRADNTIAVHIRRLRAKLGDDDAAPRYIRTVRGVGYRLDVVEEA